MKFILGQKMHMTQVHTDSGMVVPVTVIQAGPCVVSQVKTRDRDGYNAIQLSYGKKKSARKPQKKQVAGLPGIREGYGAAFTREIPLPSPIPGAERGSRIFTKNFISGDRVTITGWSKGRGFAGVVKRHHFHGHPTTHGHKDQTRMPGSIGAGGVQHVFRGQRMAGRMGSDRVTVHGLEIVSVDAENNRLTVKGAVPGSVNGFVIIIGDSGEMVFESGSPVSIKGTYEDTKSEISVPETDAMVHNVTSDKEMGI